MIDLFTIDTRLVRRIAYAMMAALFLAVGLPLARPESVSASQLTNRSIQLSDSANSGTSVSSGVGSGTSVSYQVSFTPTSQASSMVIDFCAEDPIINDTCTTPTGMTAAASTVSSVTGTIGGTGWTLTATAGRAKLADDGVSAHDMQAATAQVFDLNGITNPSTVGTFYARITTYTNTTWGTYSNATSTGNFVDYGGIALSTTSVITVTARVQEQLTFCVTKSDPTNWTTTHDCSDPVVGSAPNLPAVTLGHGSPTAVLDSNAVDHASIYSQLSTNATNGAVINLHSSNTACGGLSADGGATCAIPAINSGSGAGASALSAGTAGFGIFVSNSTPDPAGGTGTITPKAAYHNASHTTIPSDVWYGMDTTTASGASGSPPATYNGNVTTTFGSTLASASAPVYRVENTYDFGATAALTTPAGIYTANLSMIATGSF